MRIQYFFFHSDEIGENIQTMRLLLEVFMIIILIILVSMCYASIVAAAYDTSEIQTTQQNQQQQPHQQKQLPFCDEDQIQQTNRNAGLLYVSTLDGKISALDILDDGQRKWTINTTPGPMISSSIQNLELSNNGQWVRMIPSLSGSIYKFDGETVEPIPITADHLLSSSYKYSDDLVISGGKETISYGVSAQSGRVIYECSMRGCINNTDIEANEQMEKPVDSDRSPLDSDADSPPTVDDEVIIVRRKTQTVRAIEARTGEERWNFSVGQHELESIGSRDDCHTSLQNENNVHDFLTDLDLKVIVPEGLICAVSKSAPSVILWKYKFDHPIVNVWKRDEKNELVAIDLFQTVQGMWQFEGKAWTQSTDASTIDDDPDEANDPQNMKPLIYIGMFKRQLYIQESEQLRTEQMKVSVIDHMVDEIAKTTYARIPWRPIDASSSRLAEIEHESHADDTSLVTTSSEEEETAIAKRNYSATAISVLYGSEYINGDGFYLYAKPNDSTKCNKEKTSNNSEKLGNNVTTRIDVNDTIDENEQFAATPVIKFVSLWYWWREIVLICLTVLVFNVVLTQRRPSQREVVVVERHVEIKVPVTPEPTEKIFQLPAIEYPTKRSTSESNASETDGEFKSRFQTDFDMLQCLGKGGFGVVFEVKNKLDDCKYAIKRIVLPKNNQSRERVMREVKTLANCEHNNIVRYFQAWVESPPNGWQEKEDQIWMDRYALSHSIEIESPSADEPSKPYLWNAAAAAVPLQPYPQKQSVHTEVFNKNKLDALISGLQTNECINFDDELRKTNFNSTGKCDNGAGIENDDDDDSFIVFEADGSEHAESLTNASDSDASSDDEHEDDLSNSVFNKNSSAQLSTPIKLRQKKKMPTRKSLRQNLGKKKRSYSMNDSACDTKSATKNSCEIEIDPCEVICENVEPIAKVPFKRTHRRPLSLDLTSTGSVQIPIVLNPPTLNPPTYLYIQMQLCRKQSLKDWLFESDKTVRANESLGIFKQIVEAVEYVHLKGLIHRDLKPSNIFFSLDGKIKIGDFGLVTDMSENLKSMTPCGDDSGLPQCARHTQQVGTHLYMSPEQLKGRQYSYKVDIYSLGLILFELLMVFSTEMERIETIKMLRSSRFPDDFKQNFENEFKLLKLMLARNPTERPTTYGIRARPPFSESTDAAYHFELPPRRRDSQSFSSLGSSTSFSNSSSSNLKSFNK